MDKDLKQDGQSQPAGPTGGNPPGYPGVQQNPVGGNAQAYPFAIPMAYKPLHDGSTLPPNPGFPNVSEQKNPGVDLNAPGHAASLGGLGEDGEMKQFDFTDKTIRKAFVRKVYSILLTQLMVTVGFIAWFLFHQPTKYWVQAHAKIILCACLAPVIVFMLVMVCFKKARRTFPMNFILLSFFTVSMSVMLGCVTSLFDTNIVILAVGITAAVCLALTLFALQTKWDFTALGGVLCVFLTVLILFGLLSVFLRATVSIMTTVYASLGAVLFSFYLIYDTQIMMGGSHKYSITPEEYIFAALALYLDVINLFLFILRIIGIVRG